MKPLKVEVYFYPDGRNQPYTAYAIDGNRTGYDWKVGDSEIEALLKLKSTYVSWKDRPFVIIRCNPIKKEMNWNSAIAYQSDRVYDEAIQDMGKA